MNRIYTLPADVCALPPSTPSESASVIFAEDRTPADAAPGCLFLPLHYEENYAYPLIVWLHAAGENETQVRQVLPHISLRNYVAVAPRGTRRSDTGKSRRGYDWGHSVEDVAMACERVDEAVQLAAERANIEPARVFLAGCDAGGTMAIRVALESPESFAGVISVGGAFPRRHNPLANLKLVRELPLFVVHQRDSQRYQVDRLCDDLRLIHSAGMSLTVRQYPCGDEVTDGMFRDIDAWLMEQVTGVEQASEA